MDKTCRQCGYQKATTEFYKHPHNKDGLQSLCKTCMKSNVDREGARNRHTKNKDKCNKYRRDRQRAIKEQCIDYLGGKCVSCGYEVNSSNTAAFDFHHIDPQEKEFTIGGKNRLFEKMKVELDKCILLCANCHRIIHAKL